EGVQGKGSPHRGGWAARSGEDRLAGPPDDAHPVSGHPSRGAGRQRQGVGGDHFRGRWTTARLRPDTRSRLKHSRNNRSTSEKSTHCSMPPTLHREETHVHTSGSPEEGRRRRLRVRRSAFL